jgi:Xaa-Pro aminopeptidase
VTKTRRDLLRERLGELGADAMLVTKLVNVRYLSGFSGSAGALLVGADDVFFTDSRYDEQSAREVPDCQRVIPPADHDRVLAGTIAAAGIRRLAIEAAHVTLATARRWRELMPEVELVETTGVVEALRRVKDPGEVEALRRAAAIGDRAFAVALERIREGMTERELAAELEDAMRRAGSEGPSFPTIVAFGENAAEPHHRPGDRPLHPGDVVKMDFGATFAGYHSDMTRTIAFGRPPEPLVRIHQVVRDAQRAGLEAVAAGRGAGEVDAAARGVVEAAGHSFGHSTGHGCGLEVHEAPTLRRGSEDVLVAGMAVTVEPGIYLPGLGGVRIEDLVVVTDGGSEVLTRAPKDLITL